MKRTLIMIAVLLAGVGMLSAQGSLTKSASLPKVDGAIGDKEYQFTTTVNGITVYATLGTDDNVYLAVQAKTTGWVALGTGTGVMNGSAIFMGYDDGTKPVFTEQTGKGHTHGDAAKPLTSAHVVKLTDGTTVLEIVLPASVAIKNNKLDLIFAYANSTNLTARHRAMGSLSLSIK